MEIQESKRSGILILQVNGKLELGKSCASFRERFQRLLNAGNRQFVVDLRRTDKVDSAGVFELATCCRTATDCGGQTKFVFHRAGHAPSQYCITSADLHPFPDHVEWCSSIDKAVRSFDA